MRTNWNTSLKKFIAGPEPMEQNMFHFSPTLKGIKPSKNIPASFQQSLSKTTSSKASGLKNSNLQIFGKDKLMVAVCPMEV
jgi:hypothetical protein